MSLPINQDDLEEFTKKHVTPLSLLESLEKDVEGMKRLRKPTHGTCCTCQECGFSNEGDYGDCECARNKVIDEFLSLIKQYKEQLK